MFVMTMLAISNVYNEKPAARVISLSRYRRQSVVACKHSIYQRDWRLQTDSPGKKCTRFQLSYKRIIFGPLSRPGITSDKRDWAGFCGRLSNKKNMIQNKCPASCSGLSRAALVIVAEPPSGQAPRWEVSYLLCGADNINDGHPVRLRNSGRTLAALLDTHWGDCIRAKSMFLYFDEVWKSVDLGVPKSSIFLTFSTPILEAIFVDFLIQNEGFGSPRRRPEFQQKSIPRRFAWSVERCIAQAVLWKSRRRGPEASPEGLGGPT